MEGLRLAEDSSSDNSGSHEIVECMFDATFQIARSSSGSGSKVQGDTMSPSLGELNLAIVSSREGAQKLRLPVNQFQITDIRIVP